MRGREIGREGKARDPVCLFDGVILVWIGLEMDIADTQFGEGGMTVPGRSACKYNMYFFCSAIGA